MELKEGDFAYLRLHKGYVIPGLNNRKLSNQRVGPFRVLQKVGSLAYRLSLPPNMRIHPVVSVAHLEPSPGPDPYERVRNAEPPPVETSNVEEDDLPIYEIERLLKRRPVIKKGKPTTYQYLVKWKGYGMEHNQWYPLEELHDAMDLVKSYDEHHPIPITK
jgi:hypothetical protein